MSNQLKTLLAIFQESHYDLTFFRSWLKRHPRQEDWLGFQNRAAPNWTPKARIIFWLALLFSLGQARLIPAALRSASAFLSPLERIATRWFSHQARKKVLKSGLRSIIGLTGSFGKTTIKEIITQFLSQKFRVRKTPENVNTLLGVARWLAKTPLEKGDVLVVEMGAYRRGDVRAIARIVKPAVGILTGINQAHLERFGSIANTQAAKCELFDALPSGGRAFWNQDSPLCREAVAARTQEWSRRGLKLIPYSEAGASAIQMKANQPGETSLLLQIAKTVEPRWVVEAKVKLLGKHHLAALAAAVAVADELGLSVEEIRRGLQDLRPLPRRLQPSYGPNETLLIDDSYNITLDGVKAALEALRPIQRRKIGVFAGIPEAGESSAALNQDLGRLIAPVFDILILRKTPAEKAVLDGLQTASWNMANLIRYTEKGELEPMLAKVIRPRDLVYFSAYDWPAIYL